MDGNMLSRLGLLLVLGATIFSCAPKKALHSAAGPSTRGVSAPERTRIISQVVQNQSYFNTFKGRAKSRIVLNNKDVHEATLNVRIERDKAIWISVTALLGIEAGRLLITPDSIKLVNRLEGTYYVDSFDRLQEFTGRGLNFSSLQDLLTGRVVEQALGPDTDVQATEAGNILSGDGIDLSYWIQLNNEFRPALTVWKSEQADRQFQAAYSGYGVFSGRPFPVEIALAVHAGRFDIQSNMAFSSVTFDGALEMPFSVPTQYKSLQ